MIENNSIFSTHLKLPGLINADLILHGLLLPRILIQYSNIGQAA
jgi:hypothetical protein